MSKQKELKLIKEKMSTIVEILEKRGTLNDQIIEEVDRQLNLAKYGSVSHVNKVVRLSSLRNFKLRFNEVIETFKQVTDYESIETFETYIDKVLEDSKANLKSSSDALSTVELFTNGYIKQEINIKTYKELVVLYEEAIKILQGIREEVRPTKEEPVVEEAPAKKEKVSK